MSRSLSHVKVLIEHLTRRFELRKKHFRYIDGL